MRNVAYFAVLLLLYAALLQLFRKVRPHSAAMDLVGMVCTGTFNGKALAIRETYRLAICDVPLGLAAGALRGSILAALCLAASAAVGRLLVWKVSALMLKKRPSLIASGKFIDSSELAISAYFGLFVALPAILFWP